MLNKKGVRELAYLVQIDDIKPITGADNVECAEVGGWTVMVRKGAFQAGDIGIYFEVDSRLPQKEAFEFMAAKNYRVKIQRYTFGGKNKEGFYSQGLLMHPDDFGWTVGSIFVEDTNNNKHYLDDETKFLTTQLGVTYASAADNERKSGGVDKYKLMASRNSKLFKKPFIKWLYQYKLGKQLLFLLFGKQTNKYVNAKKFPVGKFEGVTITDVERCENIPNLLMDKTPLIKTYKCDGSSTTFILERKPRGKYEFYVCSRKVRMLSPEQATYFKEADTNYYWEAAEKYGIEMKMRKYLEDHPHLSFVCWQGELVHPKIQGNPHKVTEPHIFFFHMITSDSHGKMDIREAKQVWDYFNLESVPIVCDMYTLPNNMEEFKRSAEAFYPPEVCEGNTNCPAEGFVYYDTTEPNRYFKNVARSYWLKHSNDN